MCENEIGLKTIHYAPSLEVNREYSKGMLHLIPNNPHWISGNQAFWTACVHGHKNIYLIGFDFREYGKNELNNTNVKCLQNTMRRCWDTHEVPKCYILRLCWRRHRPCGLVRFFCSDSRVCAPPRLLCSALRVSRVETRLTVCCPLPF